ncbi:MAG: winged helix-turn-helix domain-containing protein [Planctomycetota bacterium]|jgi:DNA-binding MarR family transcriptional regulator|nr:winged helix-turn-helix domain-containing protein [Planctomycetota bacterium]
MAKSAQQAGGWTFLTNHAHVLICLAKDPSARMREVAKVVGVTERAVQRIVADLEADGYLVRSRTGRRNQYQIAVDLPLRHNVEAHTMVSELIKLGL